MTVFREYSPFLEISVFQRSVFFWGDGLFSEMCCFREISVRCFRSQEVGGFGADSGRFFRWTSCWEWASQLFVGPTDWLDDRDEEWYGVRVFFVAVYCYAELS